MKLSKDLNLTVAEYGPRRLVLHSVEVALAPRKWVDLNQIAEAETQVSLDTSGFAILSFGFTPKEDLQIEGVRLRLSFYGQGDHKNVQSHISFHSFAFNGVRPEQRRRPLYKNGAPRLAPLNRLLFKERAGIAWWMTCLKSTASSAALFCGARSAVQFPTAFAIYKSGAKHSVDVFQGLQSERVKVLAGRTFKFDSLLFQISNAALKTIQDYGQMVAQDQKLPLTKKASCGWSSWYKYYPRIDAQIIEKESSAVAARLKSHGFDLLQIDDGYQSNTGDWEAHPQRFPKGMSAIADVIKANGQTAGLWFAPFMVDRDSRLAKERESGDWLLRGSDGDLLRYSIPRHSTNYILDLSNPEVREFLQQSILKIRKWGFRYLKVDFLLLAACAAQRFDPTFSGLSAYREGLKIIREAAGPDTRILLSGSIDLAGIGFGDANRTGPDIAYDVLSGGSRRAFLRAQLAATAAHFFMGHRWYIPNADALMIRPPLPRSMAEVMVAQAAMVGGDYILSDDLQSLDSQRVQMLTHPEILRMISSRAHVTPLDYFENWGIGKVPPNPFSVSAQFGVPRIWLRRDTQTGQKVLFLYNLAARSVHLQRDLNDLARQTCGEDLFDDGKFQGLFHAEHLEITRARIDLIIPADSVRVFFL